MNSDLFESPENCIKYFGICFIIIWEIVLILYVAPPLLRMGLLGWAFIILLGIIAPLFVIFSTGVLISTSPDIK